MVKRKAEGIAAAIGMLVLILDSKTALAGGAEGLELCLKTVIPALFPFILLSNLLTTAFYGEALPLFSKIAGLFHIPVGISYLLIPAFLGGYPVGAQCVHRLYESGRIDRNNAERMLAFSSNVGPSFLFGILACKFSNTGTLWKIWMIQILSAYTAAQCFRVTVSIRETGISKAVFENGIELAVKTLAKVCGWILLFRILISFLDRWFLWLLPKPSHVLLIGLLELSNGCCILEQIEPEAIRFVVGNGILAFGGVCVLYQTSTVCTGLRIRYYLAGKCVQMVCAVLLAVLLQLGLWYLFPVWIAAVWLLSYVREKKSSFPKPVVV